MLVRTLSIIVATLFVGCIPVPATWFDEIRYDNMAPRLEYQGFSFERPPNRKWYFRQSEQSHTDVTLRREIFSLSTTHTFYAQVSLGGIEEVPSSHEEFAELARSKGQEAPYETRTISYKQQLTTRQNQWCIRFDSSYKVIGHPDVPDRELLMILGGYRCLHPTWRKVTLDFFYSERGLREEIDPKLSEEGEVFLQGVRIDVAPGTPAV
ncbi:MAG: hypothetical protein ACE5FA_08965 [Dehalococcoidia bacterium]